MQRRLLGNVVVTMLLAGTVPLFADVINFAALSQPGSTYLDVGSSITQKGFTFTSNVGDFYVWEASSPNLPSLNTADTSVFEFYAGATTLTANGSTFALNSIDLAPLIAGGTGSFGVTFTGTYANSSTVSQTCTVNDSPDALQTCSFSNFTNLVSVSFSQGTNSGFFAAQDTGYQFDNFNFTPAATATTPEPAGVLLLGTVLALVGRRSWTRKTGNG
jgi:hypothetical protein